MGAYVIRRIASFVPVLFFVTLVVFFVMRVLPGDPAERIAGDQAIAPESVAHLREELGLNRPLIVQYGDWMLGMAHGDFGTSLRSHQPVRDQLTRTLPITLELALLATLVMVPIGVTLGVLGGTFRGSIIDAFVSVVGSMGIAMPGFWLAILLILGFSLHLGLLPSAGFTPVWDDLDKGLRYAVLPSVTLAAPGIAVVSRQTRSAVVDVLGQDYIRTARAKGLGAKTVVVKHAVKNAIIPVITVIGLQVGLLVSSSVIVETVFAIPGIGRLLTDAIFFRDYPVVQGVTVVIVAFVLLLNLVVDLMYAFVDPRIRLA